MGEISKNNANLKWKGEVAFEGSLEQFKSFTAAMEKHPVTINVSELGNIIGKYHFAGYIRPIMETFSAEQLAKLTEGAPRMAFKGIEGIAGGIRSPHIHLAEEVVLIDKERFKTVLGDVARSLAQRRVDSEEDYFSMVKSIVAD